MRDSNQKKKEQIVFKLGEFFSGPGGIALGAKKACIETDQATYSIQHEWANDFDRDTCDTFVKNICPERPTSVHCEDVKTVKINTLLPIDGFAFGFPCNDFSIVGEQKGLDGDFGALYSYGIKILKKFEPKFFLAENVGGLRSANEGGALSLILKKLEDCGYDVVPHYYKFENYGVPQARHRVILVGTRKELGLHYRVPAPTHEIPITSREAIENPPILADAYNNDLTNQSKQVVERLKHIKPGQNAFNAVLPDDLKLNIKGVRMSQIYKRLDPSKPSYTITGSGGGGTHVYHWVENRALTNRERARLQTFPDDFIFSGSRESVRKQIGMAVPPVAAQIIFESILKCFAQIEYESVEPNLDLQYILEHV